MEATNIINQELYELCVSSGETDSKLIKSIDAFNMEKADKGYKGINCDPFIVFALNKKVSFLAFEMHIISSNRSNRLKLYYANDYEFNEENTIDLGNLEDKSVHKIVKFQFAVNTVRIDFGDYNSNITIRTLSIKEAPAWLYNLEVLKKIHMIGRMAWNNPSWMKKAIYELRYNGISGMMSKIDLKLNISNNLEQIDFQVEKNSDKIIVCIHDLSKAGAQILTYTIVKCLVDVYKFEVVVFTMKSGELLQAFEEKAKVINLNQTFVTDIVHRKKIEDSIKHLKQQGFSYAICNSSATGMLTQLLSEQGIQCLGLVHELPTTLRDYGLIDVAKVHAKYSKRLIFASNYVKNQFLEYIGSTQTNCKIYPQAINKPNKISRSAAREVITQRYNLPENAKIILGSGVGGLRKGVDAFLNVARKCVSKDNRFVFIWAGTLDTEVKNWILHDIDVLNLKKNVLILDFVPDMNNYEAAADIFLMTSREDPFPSTVMEAMYYGTPVISFDKSGGIPELLVDNRGIVVDYLDINAMTEQIFKLYDNENYRREISTTGQKYVDDNFNIDKYVEELLVSVEYPFVNKTQVNEPYKAHIRYPISKKRKKILHFIDNFSTGGSSKLVVDIVEWLGHEYEQVIVANYHPEQLEYIGIDLVTFTEATSDEEILRFINDFHPDIIHIHYWESRWYTKIIDLLEKYPSAVIIENVNIPISPYVKSYIDKYVYVSNYTLNEYGKNEENSMTIYPGSDFSFFKRELVGDYLPNDTIGMVYRLDIDKLTNFSIDVFIRVVQKRPQTKALIVGGGPRYDQYYAKVKKANLLDNFIFTGFVPYDSLIDYYKKMTIFVAPVWRESFGQVSPFAMHMGIPVTGYNIGALYEITNNKSLLAEFEDIEELSNIIVDLLNDKKKCLEIGRYNAVRAQEKFSLEKMIEDYANLYKELLER